MSRCFPFPPPGYEKKTRAEEVDLLIKDKHKEKKHKKEKDKKKDGKDKKDKEKSKDKDREKKDRKEKHRDKKKSKDKNKTDEKKVDGQPESSNGGKHHENSQEAEAFKDSRKIEGKPESSNGGKHYENNQKAEVFKDTKILEINRRITDEERGRRNQMVENPLARNPILEDSGVVRLGEKYNGSRVQGKEKIQDKDGLDRKYDVQKINAEPRVTGNSVLPNFAGVEQKRVGVGGTLRPVETEGRFVGNTVVPNFTGVEQKRAGGTPRPVEIEGRLVGNTVVSNFTGVEKKTLRPVEIEGRPAGNTVGPNLIGAEQKRVGGTPRSVEMEGRPTGNTVLPNFTGVEQKRVGGTPRPVEIEGRLIGKTVVPNFTGVEQKGVGGIPRLVEIEKAAEKIEGKEKDKDSKSNVKREGKHKHKHKHRDEEKKSKEKSVKEMEKVKEKVKHENRKPDTVIKPPNDHIHTLNLISVQIPKPSEPSASLEENPRKRKDCETNGLLHDNILPNKTPRSPLPSHPVGINGRQPEQGQAIPQLASAMHRGLNSIRFDTKVLRANGLLQAKPTSTSSPSAATPPVQARENGEASKKLPPPHPDSKYLSAILSVPKMDDWSDFDDQEWLFGNDSLQAKKPKIVSSEIDGSTQVWDRALRIDSADVCALPYVIPY